MAYNNARLGGLALLAMIIALFANHAYAQDYEDSSPFCSLLKNTVLCNEVVNGATTWEEAMAKAINAAVVQVNESTPELQILDSKLPATLKDDEMKLILDNCFNSTSVILGNLMAANESLKKDPEESLRKYLVVAYHSSRHCAYTLAKFGITIPEISSINGKFDRYTEMALDVASKKPKTIP